MPDLYFATTRNGAEQIAYAIANLHQLPQRGTHVGRGPHVDMPEEYIPGRSHIGWSARPYGTIRRLHPTQNTWGALFRTDTQALWADPEIRAARLSLGQVASFESIMAEAKALDATWNAGVPQAELAQMGVSHVAKKLAGGSNANATQAVKDAIAEAGIGGTVVLPPFQIRVDPEQIDFGHRRVIGDAFSPTSFSAIAPTVAGGDWLVRSSAPCRLEDFFVSGEIASVRSVQRVFWLSDQADTLVSHVAVGGGLDCAWHLQRVHNSKFYNCSGNSSNICGWKIVGCNATQIFAPYAAQNGHIGMWLIGPGADLTTNAGDVRIWGGTVEQNANIDPLDACNFLVDGIPSGGIYGVHCEGGGHGILIDRNTHNFQIRDCTFAGGNGPGYAVIRIRSNTPASGDTNRKTIMLTVEGNSSGSNQRPDDPNAPGTPWDNTFDRIVVEGVTAGTLPGRMHRLSGNFRNSGIQAWELRVFNEAGVLLS